MGRLVIAAFSILLLTQTCHAQAPEDVVKSYLEFAKQQKWQEAGNLMAPEALKEFREMTFFYQELPHAERMTRVFFGPDATPDTVAAMSDAEYFATFLKTGLTKTKQLGLTFKEMKIVGSVAEGEETVHVVVRLHVELGEVEMERMEVCTCLLTKDGWKIGLDKQWKGMALEMKARLGQ